MAVFEFEPVEFVPFKDRKVLQRAMDGERQDVD